MKTTIKKQVEVEIPNVPNFIRSKDGQNCISISEFSQKELEEIGKLWTLELITKAKSKKYDK